MLTIGLAFIENDNVAISSSRGRTRLVLAVLAGVVLVAAVVMRMWLTAGAMALVIVGQVGSFYVGRRLPRS